MTLCTTDAYDSDGYAVRRTNDKLGELMGLEESKPLTFLEVLVSVLAAAIGVQSKTNRQRDFSRGNVMHFILIGILVMGSFVAAIVGVVQLVLS